MFASCGRLPSQIVCARACLSGTSHGHAPLFDPPQGGGWGCGLRRSISPLAGEMPDRAEGGIDPGSVLAVSPPSVTYGVSGRATGLARPADPTARGGDWGVGFGLDVAGGLSAPPKHPYPDRLRLRLSLRPPL